MFDGLSVSPPASSGHAVLDSSGDTRESVLPEVPIYE